MLVPSSSPHLRVWVNPKKLLSDAASILAKTLAVLCPAVSRASAPFRPSPLMVPAVLPVKSRRLMRERGALQVDLSLLFGMGLIFLTPVFNLIAPKMKELDREALILAALQAATNTAASVAKMDESGRIVPEDENLVKIELERLADNIALTTNEGFCVLSAVVNPSRDACGEQVIFNSGYDHFFSTSFIPQAGSGKYCGRKWTYATLPQTLKDSMLKGHDCERRAVIGIVMFRDPNVHLAIPANIDPA